MRVVDGILLGLLCTPLPLTPSWLLCHPRSDIRGRKKNPQRAKRKKKEGNADHLTVTEESKEREGPRGQRESFHPSRPCTWGTLALPPGTAFSPDLHQTRSPSPSSDHPFHFFFCLRPTVAPAACPLLIPLPWVLVWAASAHQCTPIPALAYGRLMRLAFFLAKPSII